MLYRTKYRLSVASAAGFVALSGCSAGSNPASTVGVAGGDGLGGAATSSSGGVGNATNSSPIGGTTTNGGLSGAASTTALVNGGNASVNTTGASGGGASSSALSGTGGVSNATGGVPTPGGAKSDGGTTSAMGGNAAAGGTKASIGLGGAATTGGAKSNGGTTGNVASTAGFTSAGGASNTAGTSTAAGASSSAVIRNDEFWRDTSSTPIYSQGGGVLKVGNIYYWYGVKYNGAVTYAANPSKKNSDTSFAGVTIYSSTDLATWKLENTVKFSNAGDWFGRLGVVYNANTKKYVMVAQGAGGLFFATSSTPQGDFVFDNVQTSLPGITNGMTGDQTTFQDDDGKAYIICSSMSGRAYQYVVPLRASDFLAIETPTQIFRGSGREGNAMFKYDGHYYACSSDLHGWNASHTYCISATNILGPYGAEFVIANSDSDFSHVSQNGFYITVNGSTQSFVIYAGDRWSDFAGNGLGYNQWVPLTFNGTTPQLQSLSEWTIDAAKGTWAVGANNNYVLNPSFEADRVAVTQPAGFTTSNSANASGGHTGNWNWALAGTASLEQAVSSLPNGTYTLSAWIKSSGGPAELYAKNFGGSDKVLTLAAASGFTRVSLSGIAVTNGKCNIGISTTGSSSQTVNVDDFSLVRTGS